MEVQPIIFKVGSGTEFNRSPPQSTPHSENQSVLCVLICTLKVPSNIWEQMMSKGLVIKAAEIIDNKLCGKHKALFIEISSILWVKYSNPTPNSRSAWAKTPEPSHLATWPDDNHFSSVLRVISPAPWLLSSTRGNLGRIELNLPNKKH